MTDDILKTTKATTNAVLDKLAEVVVFHTIQQKVWESILHESRRELEHLTRAAIMTNKQGGLGSDQYQLSAINLATRIDLLETLLTTFKRKLAELAST